MFSINRNLLCVFLCAASVIVLCIETCLAESTGINACTDLRFSAEQSERILKYGKSLKQLRGLIIIQNGEIRLEKYFHGATPDEAVNIKSASKSILSALVGIAIADNIIKSPDEKIVNYVNDFFPPNDDAQKRQITIKHLLTMSSGLESASRKSYQSWFKSPNWLKNALAMKMIAVPGEKFTYSTSDTHILSAVLSRALKTDLLMFANDVLFKPAEMIVEKWQTDPQGFYFGGNDLYMRPIDLAKFGLLYLDQGKINEQQIVPEKWVETSTSNLVQPDLWSPFPVRGYGYLWWLLKICGHDVTAAWGHGGQYLLIFPDIKVVIVIISDADAKYSKKYYLSLAKMVNEYIFGCGLHS